MKKTLSLVKLGALLLASFGTQTLFAAEPASTDATVFLAAEPLTQDHVLDLQTVIYQCMTNQNFRHQVMQKSQDLTWSHYIDMHFDQMDDYDKAKALCEDIGGGLTRAEVHVFAEQARKNDPTASIHALQSRQIQSLDLDSLVGTSSMSRDQIKGMWWLHKNMPTSYCNFKTDAKMSEMEKDNFKSEMGKTAPAAAR